MIFHRLMEIIPTLGLGKHPFFSLIEMNIINLYSRDNVYSIYAVYGLALAYQRIDDSTGRACK